MSTVYRQYRPQSFAEVMGQAHVTHTLQQAIAKDRISHAYLFQGPRGTGKTSTARIFARRLNCEKARDAEACGQCASCQAFGAGRSVDVIEIDAASNRGIDDMRLLRENTRLKPAMGKYKIYIIDEVHMLTHEAFAALLKVLEEPVAHVIFILATTELHKVPPTILSRCQVYRFRRASGEQMHQRLTHILTQEKREADEAVLNFIIQRSDGCYRDAESLLGQLLVQKKKKISLADISVSLGLPDPGLVDRFLTSLVRKHTQDAVAALEEAYAQGADVEQFTVECIRTARDGALSLVKEEKALPDFAQEAQAPAALPPIVRALVQATQDFAYVPEPLIALELAVLSVCASSFATIRPRAHGRGEAPADKPSKTAGIPSSTAGKPTAAPTMSQGISVASRPASNYSAAVSAPKPPLIVEDTATAGAFSVEEARAAWPKLIEAMKQKNPVASTFLRAVEPMGVEGAVLVLRVSYPLHKSFFEKPEQKAAVEELLGELLSQNLTIRCHMITADATQLAPKKPAAVLSRPVAKPAPVQAAPADNSLYDMAKEVFG